MKRHIPNLFINGRVHEFTSPYFADVVEWEFEEYVDGDLFFVGWNMETNDIHIRGETEETFVPKEIFSELIGIFQPDKLKSAFAGKIHKNIIGAIKFFLRFPLIDKKYIPVLVDVFAVNSGGWQPRDNVRLWAAKLGINAPGYLGHKNVDEAIEYLKQRHTSFLRNYPIKKVVGRAHRSALPELIMKLAYKDIK